MADRTGSVANGEERVRGFWNDCAERLIARVETPAAAEASTAFAQALSGSTPLQFEPRWLEALDTLKLLDPTPLGERFVDVAPLLHWEPTSRADDNGADFALANVGQLRDAAALTAGIMFVRAGRQYPLHHHPHEHEVYLTIAGHANWRFGGHEDFRTIDPDTTIYNHPGDLHSAIAGDTPLVAFYVLWEDRDR